MPFIPSPEELGKSGLCCTPENISFPKKHGRDEEGIEMEIQGAGRAGKEEEGKESSLKHVVSCRRREKRRQRGSEVGSTCEYLGERERERPRGDHYR